MAEYNLDGRARPVSLPEVKAKILLEQPYIRDPNINVNELVKSYIAKIGENIKVRAVSRVWCVSKSCPLLSGDGGSGQRQRKGAPVLLFGAPVIDKVDFECR